MNMDRLTELTDDLEAEIRNDIDEFLIVSDGSRSEVRLHIPKENEDRPYCERTVSKRNPDAEDSTFKPWHRKPTAVYPPGHKEICQFCATEWVRNE